MTCNCSYYKECQQRAQKHTAIPETKQFYQNSKMHQQSTYTSGNEILKSVTTIRASLFSVAGKILSVRIQEGQRKYRNDLYRMFLFFFFLHSLEIF